MDCRITSAKAWRAIALAIIGLASVIGAVASPTVVEPDTTRRISILVASPGTEIYELEGHAGLRIIDKDGDWTVNWGVFDFAAPHFVYRFVKGETDYFIVPWNTADFLNMYAHEGRGVVEIPFDLNVEQAMRVKQLAIEATTPGNNSYRYNYVKDNCSTRPLELIEAALGDTLKMEIPAEFTSDGQLSFRKVMRYYHRYYPWYQFGIDLALGSGIDYPLSPHEMAFAPILLPELLASATIDGRRATLPPHTVVEAAPWPAKPTPWYLTPMAVAVLVLVISILVTIGDARRHKVSRWFDTILFSLFGILGCILTFLVLISSHEGTSPNWLILWLNPFALIATLVWLKSWLRIVYCYHFVNFVAILLLAISWPWTGQGCNSAFVPLLLADAMRSLSFLIINQCALQRISSYRE